MEGEQMARLTGEEYADANLEDAARHVGQTEPAGFRAGTPGVSGLRDRSFDRRSTDVDYTLDPAQARRGAAWEPTSLRGEGGMLTPRGKLTPEDRAVAERAQAGAEPEPEPDAIKDPYAMTVAGETRLDRPGVPDADLSPLTIADREQMITNRKLAEIEDARKLATEQATKELAITDARDRGIKKVIAKKQEIEDKRQKMLTGQYDKLDKLYEKWGNMKPDPNRVWANKSGFQKFAMRLAIVFNEHGGGRNSAVDMMNGEIARDIKLQEANIKRFGDSIQNRHNLLYKVSNELGDLAQAKVATAQMMRKHAVEQIETMKLRFGDRKIQLSADQAITGIMKQIAGDEMKHRAAMEKSSQEWAKQDFEQWEGRQKNLREWAKIDLEGRRVSIKERKALGIGIGKGGGRSIPTDIGRSGDWIMHPTKPNVVVGKFRTKLSAKERSNLREAFEGNEHIRTKILDVLALTEQGNRPKQGYAGPASEFFSTDEQVLIESKLKFVKNLVIRPLTGAVINQGEDKDFMKMVAADYKGWLNYDVSQLRTIWMELLRTQANHTNRLLRIHTQPNSSIKIERRDMGGGIPRMMPAEGAKWGQYSVEQEGKYLPPEPRRGAPKFVRDLDRVVLQIGTGDPAQVLRAARQAQEFVTSTGWVKAKKGVDKYRDAPIDEQTGEEVDAETAQTMLRTVRDALGAKIAEYPEEKKPKVRQSKEFLQGDRRRVADWQKRQKVRSGLIQEYGTVDDRIDKKDRTGVKKFFAGAPAVKKLKAVASRFAAKEAQLKRAGMKTKTEVAKKKAARTAKQKKSAREWREFNAKKKARKKAGTYYKKKKPAPADPEEGRE
jgi:hypothetical protein